MTLAKVGDLMIWDPNRDFASHDGGWFVVGAVLTSFGGSYNYNRNRNNAIKDYVRRTSYLEIALLGAKQAGV